MAIVVSDGDNVRWLEREFFTTSTFGQRQRSALDYKMSWTFSPSLAELCPDAAEKIYSGVKHDYFISGVSGIGYANCLSYPREHLDKFTELTARAMRDSDLNVVCLLDNISLAENEENVRDRLSCYAKYDNIYGGMGARSRPLRQRQGQNILRNGQALRTGAVHHVCGDLSRVNGKTAFDGMAAGDPAAKRVVEEYIGYLSDGIADIVNVLRPDAVLIGGRVSAQGETLLLPLRERVRSAVFGGMDYAPTEILAASLGNDAGIIGAARLAMIKCEE